MEILRNFKNHSVAVTGCCGTIGNELVCQLLNDYNVGKIIGIDHNETELFFQQQRWRNHSNAKFYLSSIRDYDRLAELFQGIDIIFHTAAYKHVILCEESPFDAVQTNILGVKNVIQAARQCKVGRVIFTSSDKAVNPTNVMGTTKLMGERLMTAANGDKNNASTIFASTRFGNVLGSRGSVIPIFREQIRKGGPITLTDSRMTRFIMSIREATNLVIDSSTLFKGGEILITKMPVIRIKDLAQVMINKLSPLFGHKPENIEIITIGSKPGEKLYEELMSEEEIRRTWELEKYFVVLPANQNIHPEDGYEYPEILQKYVERAYHSENEEFLSKNELSEFLSISNLLDESLPMQHPAERY